MKAKVIIENHKSLIELTPENGFEETMLEDAQRKDVELSTSIATENSYGVIKKTLIVRLEDKPLKEKSR